MRYDKPRVTVAMSGGVDSSVSALLLKEQGYSVQGLFMKNWEEDDTSTYCHAEKDIQDAQAVCDHLGIALHKINFSADYWTRVFHLFLEGYAAFCTPNPDVLCNKEIKFNLCLDLALERGADLFATGHYAQHLNYQLKKAVDSYKDQTYFLYTLTKDTLKKICFPIGHLKKKDVRDIAKTHRFINCAKKDSTGLCFIGERKFKSFLNHYLQPQPGVIQSLESGHVVGKHEGLMYYTQGQRQGIGVGGVPNSTGKPWYVAGKDHQRHILFVVQGREHPVLFSRKIFFEQAHFIDEPSFPFQATAKIRHGQSMDACSVHRIDHNQYLAVFEVAQWAVAPGQSIVFYHEDTCLGGGMMIRGEP